MKRKYFPDGERNTVDTRRILNTPEKIEKYMRPMFCMEPQEEFRILTLDTRMRPIESHLVSRGTCDKTEVPIRDIFMHALADGAYGIVVAHSHPSGDVEPSSEDVLATRKLRMAAKVLGIRLFDHLILGTSQNVEMNGFASLASRGVI